MRSPNTASLYPELLLTWLEKSIDFQKYHNLEDKKSEALFLSWWQDEGSHNYPWLELVIKNKYALLPTSKNIFISQYGILTGAETINKFFATQSNDSISSKSKFLLDLLSKKCNELPISDWVLLLSSVLSLCPYLSTQNNKKFLFTLLPIIWHSRADLIDKYNINTSHGRNDFVLWWEKHGLLEYQLLLSNISKILSENVPLMLPSELNFLDISISFLVKSNLIFNNFIEIGSVSSKTISSLALNLLNHDRTYLDEVIPNSSFLVDSKKLSPNDFKKLLRILYFYSRPDLVNTYQISTSADYNQWYESKDIYSNNYLDHTSNSRFRFDRAEIKGFYETANNHLLLGQLMQQWYPSAERTVNLIGNPHSSKGISFDYRSIETACINNKLEVNKIEFPVSYDDKSSTPLTFDGKTNIFIHPPFATCDFIAKYGETFIDKNKNIAYWQWEFNSITNKINSLPEFISEIWTISNFSSLAFKSRFNIPVLVCPQLIDPPIPKNPSRLKFGLTEEIFYFTFIFDGESSVKRKNPFAIIKAFGIAFPNNDGVGLILKFYNLSRDTYLELIEESVRDKRIRLIDCLMPYSDVIELISCSDCFISLHRSEGFGRLIAESMFLGIPVITSNYSGNLDYSSHENSLLVEGLEIKANPGEYQSIDKSTDFYWFEPDLEHAAHQMNECYSKLTLRNLITKKAALDISHRYNLENLMKFLLDRGL